MTNPVSDDAILNALTLLMDDFRLGNENSATGLNDTTTTSSPLDQLDAEAAELESILSSFTLYVRRKIADVRYRRNTGVRLLPPELLRTIFQLRVSDLHHSRLEASSIEQKEISCEEEGPVRSYKWEPKDVPPDTSFSAAVKIARVCSQWYSIAVSIPQLWVYIDTRHNLRSISLVLKRSKDNPLHILFSARISSVHERRILGHLIPHAHRWKSFYSYSRDLDMFRRWESKISSAPMLEHFVVHNHSGTSHPGEWRPPGWVLESSPRLQNLHVPCSTYPFKSEVRWRLTSLSVSPTDRGKMFSMEQFKLLFMESPNLETIFFNRRKSTQTSLGDDPLFSARLPHIRSIHLSGLNDQLTTALLLSIFPDADHCPVVKLTRTNKLHCPISTLLNPNRAYCLLVLVLRAMTWLSTSKLADDRDWHICGGKELHGTRKVLLEITKSIRADWMIESMLYPNRYLTLKSVELLVNHELQGADLESFPGLFPHLEYLAITMHDPTLASETIRILSTSSQRLCPQLKQLTFKQLKDLQPVLELVYGSV